MCTNPGAITHSLSWSPSSGCASGDWPSRQPSWGELGGCRINGPVPRASLARPMHRHFRHSSQQRSPNNSSPGPVPPIQSASPCQPNLRRRLDRLVFCDPRRPTTNTPRADRAKRPRDDRRRLSATDRPRAAFPRPFHLIDTPPEALTSRWPRGKRFFSRFALPA